MSDQDVLVEPHINGIHTMRMLEVDAISNAMVPIISFPASGFACKVKVESNSIKIGKFLLNLE